MRRYLVRDTRRLMRKQRVMCIWRWRRRTRDARTWCISNALCRKVSRPIIVSLHVPPCPSFLASLLHSLPPRRLTLAYVIKCRHVLHTLQTLHTSQRFVYHDLVQCANVIDVQLPQRDRCVIMSIT